MPHSDSEGEEIDDLEFDAGTSEAEQDEDAEADEDTIDPLDNDADDASEGDDVCSYPSFCLTFNFHHPGFSLRRL